jgi:DNA-binding transcriptional ArsR family regulator
MTYGLSLAAQAVPDMSLFRAISDPTRRAILDLPQEGEGSVREIAAAFAVNRSAISQHLRVLRDAGLLQDCHAGRWLIYSLEPSQLAAVDEWLASYRDFWRRNLGSLGCLDGDRG